MDKAIIVAIIGASGAVIAALIPIVLTIERRKQKGLQVWADRANISPPIIERIISSQKSLFFVGFTFGTTLKDHGEYIKTALMTHNNLEIKLLMVHPDSPHVTEHQNFSNRNIQNQLHDGIAELHALFDELSPAAQGRIKARATYYLPRFSARIFDDEIMLLNFYLYKSKAHVNPVIEIHRDKHEKEFSQIFNNLNEMFKIGDDENAPRPNHHIIENGNWNGLPEESDVMEKC